MTMPRVARAVAIGCPHHVTQRGNYEQTVFDDDRDRRRYLTWAVKDCQRYGLKIWAYCLMTNHVHFIGVPEREESLGRTFNLLHMRYAQYLNKKRKRSGHLWQGRFFSCALDETHLWAAVRYVERNPVRARLVRRPEDYVWSSARAHILGITDPLLSRDCPLAEQIPDWSTYLGEGEDSHVVEAVRVSTRTGRPAGDAEFIQRIEQQLGRRLAALPRGRPVKTGR
jgi:putative transposase